MWDIQTKQLEDGRGVKLSLHSASSAVAYSEVIRLWRDDAEFRSMFSEQLAQAPYTAFRWETPAIMTATADRPFECVILDSPGLERRATPQPFAEHFADALDAGQTPGVIEFANLSGDAIMVVPCPVATASKYAHFGSFLRNAPESQQHALWECVGMAMSQRLNDKPVWLSTAGAGVAWLHLRLDDRPKYYGYRPYREVG